MPLCLYLISVIIGAAEEDKTPTLMHYVPHVSSHLTMQSNSPAT